MSGNHELADKTFARPLKAASLLEPLFTTYPQHPGVAHYLIHSYDNPALAPKGLDAAKRYAQIAPSAPHAQHMPSYCLGAASRTQGRGRPHRATGGGRS